ncbi:glycosyltransferase family 4 protein [Mesobacillus zeae]|uniref:Glycosyltransferase family 1 protein n=1 Tax=Mesobacillus zeae TaxID=1917180 RepID=A0A398AWV0_9BACI|nr:glycosyltransferase family 4 protein [Mesobacillus zeae]RID82137.1 glycosyltransferase family 1 protein [Mesobacillus zeae]
MKILITTIFQYPHEGGLSTHVSTLKKGLEELGHSVDVLSFSDMNPLIRKVYAQAPGFLINKFNKGKGQLLNDRQKRKLLSSYLEQRKGQYDLINSQDVYAAIAAIETGVPTVATVHGYFSFEAISRGAIIKGSEEDKEILETERQAYKNAAKVIAVDKRIREYILEQTDVEAFTIKNFIDVNDFQPAKEDHSKVRAEFGLPENAKILFVPRRLTEKNGVTYPALSLRKVLEKHPDTMLVYAGTGEQQGRIEEIMAEQGLQKNIKLLGSVPHEKMKGLYAAADIVLVPSVHSYGVEEATSISALEAMGSGAPVVAGAVGGLKEIFVHEQDGLLVDVQNISQFSDSIIRILDDPSFGQKLADLARSKVEDEYSHLAAAGKYAEIYEAALADHRKK